MYTQTRYTDTKPIQPHMYTYTLQIALYWLVTANEMNKEIFFSYAAMNEMSHTDSGYF